MMRALLAATLFATPVALHAQKIDTPPIVTQGLEVYMKAGGDSALNLWLGWWPATDSANVKELHMFVSVLKNNFGTPKGYEVVATTALGTRIRYSYVILWFDEKPVYLTLRSYQTPTGEWHVLYVGGNTDVAKFWGADPNALVNRVWSSTR